MDSIKHRVIYAVPTAGGHERIHYIDCIRQETALVYIRSVRACGYRLVTVRPLNYA